MSTQYAADALTAWKELSEQAGLEPTGRDQDLAERLRVLLQPSAPDLTSAMQGRTAQDLIAAFFDAQQDFVVMLRAILAFYEAAGAKWGKHQWRLQVDADALGLAHFQEFLEQWDRVPYDVEVPSIDLHGAWAARDAAGAAKGFQQWYDVLLDENDAGDVAISDWLNALNRGHYSPLPASLHMMQMHDSVADAFALTASALGIIRRIWPDRNASLARRARNYEYDKQDGLSPQTLVQMEGDDWLAHNVKLLIQYRDSSPAAQEAFADNLRSRYAAYPRRRLIMTADRARVDELLSLPVWKKRHELYAVWIGAETLGAMKEHDVELHHDNGTIRFGFAKTLLATVHSTAPKMRLYIERRTELQSPIGKGRVAGVQPDFTLWRGMEEADTCKLVIEVKHYKKNAPSSFGAAMVDYARAHNDAKVVLVNHGPAKGIFPKEFLKEADRCTAIGNLTASHKAARTDLSEIVQKVIGTPHLPMSLPAAHAAMVLDISYSMREALSNYRLPDFLDSLAGRSQPELIQVDCQIRQRGPLHKLAPQLINGLYMGDTDLQAPLEQLLNEFGVLTFITDKEGLEQTRALDGIAIRNETPAYLLWADLHVVEVVARA